jgi:hypothetical protein
VTVSEINEMREQLLLWQRDTAANAGSGSSREATEKKSGVKIFERLRTMNLVSSF